jgi:hypothetical protein
MQIPELATVAPDRYTPTPAPVPSAPVDRLAVHRAWEARRLGERE